VIAYRIFGLLRLQFLVQCVLVVGLYWALMWGMEAMVGGEPFLVGRYASYCVVVVVAMVMELLSRNSERRQVFRRRMGRKMGSALRQVLFITAGMSLYLVLTKDQAISRAFLVAFLGVVFLALNASEYFLARLLSQAIFGAKGNARTLLVGSARSVLAFQEWAHEKRMYGLQIVGALSDEGESAFGGALAGMWIGGENEVGRKMAEHRIDQLVLVEPVDDMERVREMIRLCEIHGIRFVLVNDMSEWAGRKLASRNLDGMNMTFLYEEPLEDPVNQILKRAFDMAVALVACGTVLPAACVLVAVIHRLQSRGPLYFRQKRIGIKGEAFEIYKFRTLHDRPHEEGKQVSVGDDRVFAGGRFLRKFSIDELPQFLNVLRGEMSVIGPRPHFLEHDAYFAKLLQNYKTRSLVKPGITGLAQVRGYRGSTEGAGHIEQRIISDISYLENWSLSLDIVILCRTFYHMLFPPKSAY